MFRAHEDKVSAAVVKPIPETQDLTHTKTFKYFYVVESNKTIDYLHCSSIELTTTSPPAQFKHSLHTGKDNRPLLCMHGYTVSDPCSMETSLGLARWTAPMKISALYRVSFARYARLKFKNSLCI